MQTQLQAVNHLHERDIAFGYGDVYLPGDFIPLAAVEFGDDPVRPG